MVAGLVSLGLHRMPALREMQLMARFQHALPQASCESIAYAALPLPGQWLLNVRAAGRNAPEHAPGAVPTSRGGRPDPPGDQTVQALLGAAGRREAVVCGRGVVDLLRQQLAQHKHLQGRPRTHIRHECCR
jgi:hypothetical protein